MLKYGVLIKASSVILKGQVDSIVLKQRTQENTVLLISLSRIMMSTKCVFQDEIEASNAFLFANDQMTTKH